jgi:hypothetical protein
MNRIDSTLFPQGKNTLFPLYSFALETKKEGHSFGFRLENSFPQEGIPFMAKNQGLNQLQRSPQYLNGYAEKRFINGRVTLSVHATAILPK